MLRAAGMIFVTVGNVTQQFRRLLDAIDAMSGAGELKDERVIVQSGSNSDFAGRHCVQQDFFPPDEYRKLIHDARVVVCHGGAGTLHHVFHARKVPVVMPRRRKYGEHVDDQYQFVKALAEQRRIIAAFEPPDLKEAIDQATRYQDLAPPASPTHAIQLIQKAIDELCTSSG
jgi:UDP-N-acetylglucosamine transferase subunit ALG13